MKTLAERFWPHVTVAEPDDCWMWTGGTNEHGYGMICHRDANRVKMVKAHRAAMIIAGYDIEGWKVLHRCDNPPCVNPRHLRLGTQRQNIQDIFARDRQAAHQRPRLSGEQVAEVIRLRKEGMLQRDIGERLGVSRRTIGRYLHRQDAA